MKKTVVQAPANSDAVATVERKQSIQEEKFGDRSGSAIKVSWCDVKEPEQLQTNG
jgi:hypothetical protein